MTPRFAGPCGRLPARAMGLAMCCAPPSEDAEKTMSAFRIAISSDLSTTMLGQFDANAACAGPTN